MGGHLPFFGLRKNGDGSHLSILSKVERGMVWDGHLSYVFKVEGEWGGHLYCLSKGEQEL